MSDDWASLSARWRSAPPSLPSAQTELLLRRARREALRWRLTWWLVQACLLPIFAIGGWTLLQAETWPARLVGPAMAGLALYARLAARRDMQRVLVAGEASPRGHVQAMLARAETMPRFVAIDMVAYAGIALIAALMTWDWWQAGSLFGIDWRDGRDGPWLLWIIVLVGVGYDLYRLRAARAQSRWLRAMLRELDAPEP